jgi:hypothetical protein
MLYHFRPCSKWCKISVENEIFLDQYPANYLQYVIAFHVAQPQTQRSEVKQSLLSETAFLCCCNRGAADKYLDGHDFTAESGSHLHKRCPRSPKLKKRGLIEQNLL